MFRYLLDEMGMDTAGIMGALERRPNLLGYGLPHTARRIFDTQF